MHVAMVCPYSFAEPGGVQEHVRGLARALTLRGHTVTVFAPDREDGESDGIVHVSLGRSVAIRANGSVAPVGIDPRMLLRYDLALDPADVIHVHEPFLPASIAATLRAPRTVPVVGTFHAAGDRSTPYALARGLLRRLVRRLAATTAVSPAARDLVARYVTVDPVIVPNGVDVEAFADAEPDPWMRALGRTVLFVGRPEPRKGFDVAVRAFSAAAADRPDVHMVCVPAAPGSAQPLSAAAAERLHCLGTVPRSRLLALYRAADVACFPAAGQESFGLVVVEAMAAGCAVLCSDIPGYAFAAGDAAALVPPGDIAAWRRALEHVLDDGAYRSRLARAGPLRAEMFDWPGIAGQMERVYEDAAVLR